MMCCGGWYKSTRGDWTNRRGSHHWSAHTHTIIKMMISFLKDSFYHDDDDDAAAAADDDDDDDDGPKRGYGGVSPIANW